MNRILAHKKRANESQGGFFPLKLVRRCRVGVTEPPPDWVRGRRSGISAASSQSRNNPCENRGLFTGDTSVLPENRLGSGCLCLCRDSAAAARAVRARPGLASLLSLQELESWIQESENVKKRARNDLRRGKWQGPRGCLVLL